MEEIRCSVCMTAYNGERYIAKQVASIISQLSADDELIVSDDGSFDNTIGILQNFQKTSIVPIRILKHEKKLIEKNKYGKNFIYTSRNFENAIKSAKGKYIFLADQDDIWLPEKLQLFLQAFERDSLLVFSNYVVCDENENIIKSAYFSKNPQNWSFIRKNISPLYWGCCMAFKSELLNWILPFPQNLYCHDAFIGLIASLCAEKNRIFFIEQPTLLYRRHIGTVSTGTKKSINPLWFKMAWRISLLCDVIKRTIKIKRGISK